MAKDKWRVSPKPVAATELSPEEKRKAEAAVAAEMQKPAPKTLTQQVVAGMRPKAPGLVGKLPPALTPPKGKSLKPQKKKISMKLFILVTAALIIAAALLTYLPRLR